jgi:hypothetical protein
MTRIGMEGIRVVHGSPGGGGGIGNRSPCVNAPRSQRPNDRADQRPLAPEKSGCACHIDLQTLRPQRFMLRRFLDRHERCEPPTIAGDLLERCQIGHGIVLFDLSDMAGSGAMRQRQHSHRFGERHA